MQLSNIAKKASQKIIDKSYRFSMTDFQKKIENEIVESVNSFELGPQGIVEEVKKKGFVILNQALSPASLELIKKEFHKILNEDISKFSSVDRHNGATCVRFKPFLTLENSKKYPAISAFYFAPVLKTITKLFYAPNHDIEYISEIFVHETPETDEPLSGAIHWDRAQTLKFWIYVDDLPEDAGPMLIDPLSVEKNKQVRMTARKKNQHLIGGVDNVVETNSANMISLVARQGSIMIHDTDASHGASPVRPGYTRRIIRGHCREK